MDLTKEENISGIESELTKIRQNTSPSTVYTAGTVNTNLLTDILNRNGRGRIIAIIVNDSDNLVQNEFLKITVDGAVVIPETGADAPNSNRLLWFASSIASQSIDISLLETIANYSQNRDTGLFYNTSIRIEARRAAAGANGFRVRVMEERYA
jgi:hypothetical protein